jgi:hypothetical protein
MVNPKKVAQRVSKVAYFSPLRLPKGKKGKFSIEHSIEEAGASLPVVSQRDAIFWSMMGRKTYASNITLSEPHLIHKLKEDGDTWMSDCPQEIMSHEWQIKRFKGEVLVGGLGLGLALVGLERNPDVKVVTVVEKSQNVIDLVWKHLRLKKTELIQEDLYKFLKSAKQLGLRWDYGYYDIWCPTGERVLTESIRPLRELSYGIIKSQKNLECWEELTMLGQVLSGLHSQIQMWDIPQPHHSLQNVPEKEFGHYRKMFTTQFAFINWMRRTKPSKELAMFMLSHYIKTYTDPKVWRKTWGKWDK